MENIFAFQAIQKLVPNADCTIGETYESINWTHESREKPTEKKFDEALKNVKAEYDAQEYARNRAAEYPSNGDQWDMIYKDNKNSTTTHADAVEAVKTKWPKDNSGPV